MDYLSLCWNFNMRMGNSLQDTVPHRKCHIVSKTQLYSVLHLLELKLLISLGSTSPLTMIALKHNGNTGSINIIALSQR